MVKVHLKALHSVNDVQETVLGMLDHCLAILHEQDKKACFINKKQTREVRPLIFLETLRTFMTIGANGMSLYVPF